MGPKGTLAIVAVAVSLASLASGECVAVDSRVTDEWCVANGCEVAYPGYCSLSEGGGGAGDNGGDGADDGNSGSGTGSAVTCNENDLVSSLAEHASKLENGQVDSIQLELPGELTVTWEVRTGAQAFGLAFSFKTAAKAEFVASSIEVRDAKAVLVVSDRTGQLKVTQKTSAAAARSSNVVASALAIATACTCEPRTAGYAGALAAVSLMVTGVDAACAGGDTVHIAITIPSGSRFSSLEDFVTTSVSNNGGTLAFAKVSSRATLAPVTRSPTIPPTIPAPTTRSPTRSPIVAGASATRVFAELTNSQAAIESEVLVWQTPDMSWAPSTLYRFNDLLKGVEVMHTKGAAGFQLYLGAESEGEKAHLYGLVNIAAFLAQSMKETIKYNACDENSWDLVNGKYPASNACGQLGQSYQDYTCDAGEEDMQCPIDPSMAITATTNALWYGAPGPLRCGPKSSIPVAGYWDYSAPCPPEGCNAYEGQKAGVLVLEAAPNGKQRTDVEGCCWWGRGVIQTTGPCNIGKLNYFLGAKAKSRGMDAPYPTVDFCSDPGAICASAEFPELKWIAGLFYWMNAVQTFDTAEFSYLSELRSFVDNGLAGTAFIDAVSGIVNRGCPRANCGSGAVDGLGDRQSNFEKVLKAFGLK